MEGPSFPSSNNNNPSVSTTSDKPFKVLEFYSGIGGLREGLQSAWSNVIGSNKNIVFLEAFDVNCNANSTYHHNYQHKVFNVEIIKFSQFRKIFLI
jgi:site-specific DNA-cytosine methylase